MTGRTFYIDPLHGSSANDGLTSAEFASGTNGPFGSLTDVWWNGNCADHGGSGDTFFCVASTADVIGDGTSTQYLGYSFNDSVRWAYNVHLNKKMEEYQPQFVGVNENLVEEENTHYTIEWRPPYLSGSNQYKFFDDYSADISFRQLEWKCIGYDGAMYYHTSGGHGFYFVDCIFDWSGVEDANVTSGSIFSSGNPSTSVKNCTFIGAGDRQKTAMNIGAIYGQHSASYGCRYENWNTAFVQRAGNLSGCFMGNIVKNCNTGVYGGVVSGLGGGHTLVMNNLFYDVDKPVDIAGKLGARIMNNLMIDVGSYALADSSGTTNFDLTTGLIYFCFRRNIIQNATSGIIAPEIIAFQNGSLIGYTGPNSMWGNISDNKVVTGLTLDIADDFSFTLECPPELLAPGMTTDLNEVISPNTSVGLFMTTGGYSGGITNEGQQERISQ